MSEMALLVKSVGYMFNKGIGSGVGVDIDEDPCIFVSHPMELGPRLLNFQSPCS